MDQGRVRGGVRVVGRRPRGGVAALVGATALLGILTGCGVAPEPSPSTTASATPDPVVAAPGESALPLGCADLLDVAEVADLAWDGDQPLTVAIDGVHFALDSTIPLLQSGVLRCVWSTRYSASDFHSELEVRVRPADDPDPDPASLGALFEGRGPLDRNLEPLAGEAETLTSCEEFEVSSDTPSVATCLAVLDSSGYRVEILASGLDIRGGDLAGSVRFLLPPLRDALASAGVPRDIPEPAVGADPGAVCAGPELAPIVASFGLDAAQLTVDPEEDGEVTCRWPDADGSSVLFVNVYPGASWVADRFADGVSSFWITYRLSDGGDYLVGSGEGLGAWRAIGSDLIQVLAYPETSDGDAWTELLASTW